MHRAVSSAASRAFALGVLCVPLLLHAQTREPAEIRTWTFDEAPAGSAPAGFEPGVHVPSPKPDGRWEILDDARNHILAQLSDAVGGHRVLVARGAAFEDVAVSVRFKGVGGDRAAGLVWRYTPDGDHYLARLNLSQQRLAVYKVVRATRSRIATLDGLELDPSRWHTLKVEQRGDAIRVWLNGIPVADTRDRTIQAAGRVGVWTSPNSTAWFDDLKATPLRP